MLGVGESRVGRLLVAHHQRERDIVGRLVPYRRCAGFDRILDSDDRRQRLVFDFEQLGRVPCLQQRFRHDERDAVADGAHLVGFEDRAQRAKTLRTAHVFRHGRRQAAELVGDDIGAGEHGECARGGLGLRSVHALDAGVGVRRHNDDAVALARQLDVVNIAAAAGDEAGVLDPGHGLTDAELVHAHLLDVVRSGLMPASYGR